MDNLARVSTHVLDMAEKPEVTVELLSGQQQQIVLQSSTTQKAFSLELILHKHSECALLFNNIEYLPSTITLKIVLLGEHAKVSVVGRMVTTGTQQVGVHAQITHQAHSTQSLFDLKGVAHNASRVQFWGSVLLQNSAHYAQATMHHKHLVVGTDARVVSQPELEALHHTVQCGHGSAISYVDAEQLFYITSRGINPERAQALLIESFLSIDK